MDIWNLKIVLKIPFLFPSLFNSFMTEAVIIQKPVHWFAEQYNLIFYWYTAPQRQNTTEYGFSLNRIFPSKDKILDTVLIQEYVSEKTRILIYTAQWYIQRSI